MINQANSAYIKMKSAIFPSVGKTKVYGIVLMLMVFAYPVILFARYRFFLAVIAFSVFVVLCYDFYNGKIAVKRYSNALCVYLFFILPFLSCFWAIYPYQTLRSSMILLTNLWVFYVAQVSLERNRKLIYHIAVLLPFLCLAIFIAIFIHWGSIRPSSAEMAESVGSFCNTAPALTELFFPFLVCMMYLKAIKKRIAIWALLAYLFVVFLSQSRGAYLMLSINLILAMLLMGDNFRKKIRITSGILAILIAAILVTLGTIGYNRTIGIVEKRYLDSRLFSMDEDATNHPANNDYMRLVMYYEGGRAIVQHPLTGIGYNGLPSYIEEKYGFSVVSHNIIITAWGEMGIPGIVLLLYIVITAFRKIWWVRRVTSVRDLEAFSFYTASLISLMVGLIHALFQPQLHNPAFLLILAIPFAKINRGLSLSDLWIRGQN